MDNKILVYERTGEVRPPQAGEWFSGYGGAPTHAAFDFTVQEFPILRQIIKDRGNDEIADAKEGQNENAD